MTLRSAVLATMSRAGPSVYLTGLLLCGGALAAPSPGTPLLDAAEAGDAAAVRSLLGQRADVNTLAPDGTSALHWVVRRNDLETARLLIRAGADVSQANHYGVAPLALAAANGNAEMIRILIDAGADPNAADGTGETALMGAARSGSAAAVKMLLDRGAAVDGKDPAFQQTALMLAVRENHPAIVKLLIDRKADVNARTRTGPTPAPRPPGAGGGSHGQGIVRGGWPEQGMRNPIPGAMTSLLYAARDGRSESAKLLLSAGADIEQADANGITPLLMAITNNQVDVARLLLEKGADIQAADWYGRTPLWAAVDVRNAEVRDSKAGNGIDRAAALQLVEVLLQKGADANARIKEVPPIRRWLMPLGSLSWVDFTGETPFLRASLAGDVAAMRLLLEHGADPHIGTFKGTTPLMAAAGINWVPNQTFDEGPQALLEAVKLCVELGMDVNATNSMGLAAIHGAANRGSDHILQFLVDQGARLDLADKEGRMPMTWAEGVFLATHAPEPKPSTIALIKKLQGAARVAGSARQ